MTHKPISRGTLEELRSFAQLLVRGLVDHPEWVEVNVVHGSHRLVIELHTAESDVGQVIGKEGRVINAIRTLIIAHGGREGLRIDIDFVTDRTLRVARADGR